MKHGFTKWLALAVGLMLTLGACGTNEAYTSLTPDQPVLTLPEGLSVSANPTTLPADFKLNVSALDSTKFIQGDVAGALKPAVSALPANLRPLGAIFTLKSTGQNPPATFLSFVIPTSATSTALDLYAWDGQSWAFLPSHPQGGQLMANVSQLPQAVALFEAAHLPPVTLTTLEPGQTVANIPNNALNGVLLGGVFAQTDGGLAGQLPGVPAGIPQYPVIRNYTADGVQADVLPAILGNPEVRTKHLGMLIGFAGGGYNGLTLDYRGVTPELAPAYAQFVHDLAEQLRAQNKQLFVLVEPATRTGDVFNTGGYDWAILGASADALLVSMGDDPRAYGDGSAEALMLWATGEVNRNRLRLFTSALSVESANGQFVTLDQTAALAPLGGVAVDAAETTTGSPVTATLSGPAQSLTYDEQATATSYTYADAQGQTHTLWLTEADTLRQRLALAEKYHLGGVVVRDLAANVPAALAKTLSEYKANVAANIRAQAALLWTVRTGEQVVEMATAQPGEPYVYVAAAPGAYQISAELQGGNTVSLGAASVQVADPTPTPTPEPTKAVSANNFGGGNGGGGGGGGSDGGGGVFVPPPPIGAGTFELGGQVPGSINHPNYMHQAGMKWVKFQARGGGQDYIANAHANGFKVLLSAIGDKSRVTDPAYWNEYAAWVGGLAASGADAIEVWNEPNIDHEWPAGQLSASTYTQLLAKAYTAIKAANGNTIVISGGPAPTGAESAFPGRVMNDDRFMREMAAAGAANYMDCIGIHYNEGILSPYQTSGDPRDSFYSRYYGSMVDLYWGAFGGTRPLCFTELGYLTGEGYGDLPAYFAWASGTSVSEQAQWLAEAASLSGSNGKVRLMIVWNVDFTLWSGDPQAGYAMVRPDGSCPACAALDAVMP